MIVRFVDIDGIVDHYCFRRYKQSTIFHNNYLHVISAVLLYCPFFYYIISLRKPQVSNYNVVLLVLHFVRISVMIKSRKC